MTSDDRFGGTVSGWLHQRAGTGAPDYLDDILGRTARTRQRPGWTSIERWPPMSISTSRAALPLRFPIRSMALLAIIGLLLVAIAVAILAVGSRQGLPAPFGPARNGALVYSADGDIYRLGTADGVPSVIVGGLTDDHDPLFSRDGSKFLFRRSSGSIHERLGVASADGSDPRVLTGDLDGIGGVDWSPDGSQFAVIHTLLGLGVVSIVDATGKEPTHSLDLGDVRPLDWIAWRPEAGGTLFFRGEHAYSGQVGIFAVRPDGSDIRVVAEPRAPDAGGYDDPSISADGARLTYSNFEPSVIDGRTDGWSHVLDLETGDDHQVRFGDLDAEIRGQFSPDGSRILYERQRILPDDDWDRQVVVGPSDPAGGGATVTIGPPFGHEAGLISGFAFSPDGQQVVLTIGPTTQLYDANDGTPVGDPLTMAELPSYQRLAP
jgi:dipeptidyl aminopeptidase/acylaminoacyl peptidase